MKYYNGKTIFTSKERIRDADAFIGAKYASDDLLAEYGIYPIKEVEHNPAIEKLGGYILVNGYYEQEIIPFTAEEIVLKNKDLVPFSVPNMAIRLSLINAGISIKSIDEAIAMMPDGVDKEQIQTMWDYAVYFERNNETLISMATNLGISEAVLDQLFINAQ